MAATSARRVAVLLLALLVGGTASAGLPAAAAPGPAPFAVRSDSVDHAQRAASHASHDLAGWQRRLHQAVVRYRHALVGLAHSVNASVASEQVASQAAQDAQAAAAGRVADIRAIYMTGGSVGMLGTLLDAQSPSDLASRLMFVSQVLAMNQSTSATARRAAQRAQTIANQRRQAAQRQIAQASSVAAAAQRLQRIVSRSKALAKALHDRADRLQAAQALAAAQAAAAAATSQAASSVKAGGIPENYLALYRAAAPTCPMPWVVLAAIGQVESGHGSNMGPSSAGAMGPMQFLPSTFAAYAVDGDGDGVANIMDPADAIYTAARYLCANGAGHGPHGLYQAIFRYNHADWYVQMVMNVAAQLAQRFGQPVPVATR